MKLFNFDPETGELLGTAEARESPREPGVFLTPAFSTPDEPPPTSSGYVAVFLTENGLPPADYQAGSWTEKSDQRGQYWQTSDARLVYLNDVGVDPSERGLTDQEPVGLVKWDGTAWIADIDRISNDAKAKKSQLLALAASQIAPLADAVDLGIATPLETQTLAAWKQYRVAISRIEQQARFPLDVSWPVTPTS